MSLAVTRFVIEAYVARVDIGAAIKLCMKILDLSSEPFCGHGIEASDDGNQIYVPAEMFTVKNHIFFLPVIHYS